MLFALDVGNTNIACGLFDGDRLVHEIRTESSRTRTADEYTVLLRRMLTMRGVQPSSVTSAILASVVPVLTDVLVDAIRRGFAREPMVVGQGTRTGTSILYENPRELGADRLVNAIAAFEKVRAGAIVVDFGTATKLDCVSPRGEYLGGAIVPGIAISSEALYRNASRLRRIAIAPPTRVVGRSVGESLRSGLIFGYAGLVDGLVAEMKRELGFPCTVLATGGLAPLVAPHARSIERLESALTLEGLRVIHDRNRS